MSGFDRPPPWLSIISIRSSQLSQTETCTLAENVCAYGCELFRVAKVEAPVKLFSIAAATATCCRGDPEVGQNESGYLTPIVTRTPKREESNWLQFRVQIA